MRKRNNRINDKKSAAIEQNDIGKVAPINESEPVAIIASGSSKKISKSISYKSSMMSQFESDFDISESKDNSISVGSNDSNEIVKSSLNAVSIKTPHRVSADKSKSLHRQSSIFESDSGGDEESNSGDNIRSPESIGGAFYRDESYDTVSMQSMVSLSITNSKVDNGNESMASGSSKFSRRKVLNMQSLNMSSRFISQMSSFMDDDESDNNSSVYDQRVSFLRNDSNIDNDYENSELETGRLSMQSNNIFSRFVSRMNSLMNDEESEIGSEVNEPLEQEKEHDVLSSLDKKGQKDVSNEQIQSIAPNPKVIIERIKFVNSQRNLIDKDNNNVNIKKTNRSEIMRRVQLMKSSNNVDTVVTTDASSIGQGMESSPLDTTIVGTNDILNRINQMHVTSK